MKERKAFGGKSILDFQNTQFKLAECKTEATVAKVFVDHCTQLHLERRSWMGQRPPCRNTGSRTFRTRSLMNACSSMAATAIWMNMPIGQMYQDARVQRIYGGANEVMKMLIARTL